MIQLNGPSSSVAHSPRWSPIPATSVAIRVRLKNTRTGNRSSKKRVPHARIARNGTADGGMVQGMRWKSLRASDQYTADPSRQADRKSTRLNSSHSQISYAVFCLKKKKKNKKNKNHKN